MKELFKTTLIGAGTIALSFLIIYLICLDSTGIVVGVLFIIAFSLLVGAMMRALYELLKILDW